ncbi:MAG: superoxide dismutase family protein [Clostridia bacterium]|nr:superoxide dismutase family protein [Clostridia bacterium]
MNNFTDFLRCIKSQPAAVAEMRGSAKHPEIRGMVKFYNARGGVLVRAEITGLPKGSGDCDSPIFAFHIHSGNSCTGNHTDMFANTGTHFNPYDCMHPYHAGDLPPLFSANGNAVLEVMTDRFAIPQIIGKTVIIHDRPDDFTTQPSGNAGEKIACGVVRKHRL